MKPDKGYVHTRKNPQRLIRLNREMAEREAAAAASMQRRQITEPNIAENVTPEVLIVDVEPADVLDASETGKSEEVDELKCVTNKKKVTKFVQKAKSKDLTETSSATKTSKSSTLSWSSHSRQLTNGLWTYFEQNFNTDFELCTTNSVGGDYVVKVHHLILSIFCPTLKDVADKRLSLDINEEDLNVLVEFLYRGQINLPDERMVNVMNAASELGFTVLANMIEKFVGVRNEIKRGRKSPKSLMTTFQSPEAKKNTEEIKENIEADNKNPGEVNQLEGESIGDTKALNPSRKERTSRRSPKLPRNGNTTTANFSGSVKRGFSCDVCDKRFIKRARYLNHIRVHLDAGEVVQCQLCPFKASTEVGLRTHLGIKHRNHPKSKSFRCSQCMYMCHTNRYLKTHMKNAHGTKVFLCEKCPYTCRTQGVLKKHLQVYHTSERAYMCDKCGYRAKTTSRLKKHQLKHQEKVKCDVCGLSLAGSAINRHKALHSGARKQFPCHLCAFATRDRYNLRVHLKNVHNLTVTEVQNLILSNFPYCSSVREERSLAMSTFNSNSKDE